jgi:hypothetical protein
MLTSFVALTALAGSAAAHFELLQPTWRGDSFEAPASQYTFPCAGINATTDAANRTQWPLTGGSVVFNGSHPWAFTYVNLALGVNGSSFNISLVPAFNQTGKGVFCFKVRLASAAFRPVLRVCALQGVTTADTRAGNRSRKSRSRSESRGLQRSRRSTLERPRCHSPGRPAW